MHQEQGLTDKRKAPAFRAQFGLTGSVWHNWQMCKGDAWGVARQSTFCLPTAVVRQLLVPLICLREVPLNIKVLPQSPLKTTGALPILSMRFSLKHALPSQFNQTGYKAVLSLNEML